MPIWLMPAVIRCSPQLKSPGRINSTPLFHSRRMSDSGFATPKSTKQIDFLRHSTEIFNMPHQAAAPCMEPQVTYIEWQFYSRVSQPCVPHGKTTRVAGSTPPCTVRLCRYADAYSMRCLLRASKLCRLDVNAAVRVKSKWLLGIWT